MEIRWYMNQEFRLALLRNWVKKSPYMAIDFTRYDLPAHELHRLQRDWSLMNVLNQKETRPQDKAKRLGKFRRLISADLCEVSGAEAVGLRGAGESFLHGSEGEMHRLSMGEGAWRWL